MITRVGIHSVSCNSFEKVNYDELLGGKKAAILYSDPPWGDGNIKYWATMNKKDTGIEIIPLAYAQLLDFTVDIIVKYVDGFVFIETGKRWVDIVVNKLTPVLKSVKVANLSYRGGSKILPNILVYGSSNGKVYPAEISETLLDYNSVRDTIKPIAEAGKILFDPFCGIGYSAKAAVEFGMVFCGNELNSVRLNKTIAKLK